MKRKLYLLSIIGILFSSISVFGQKTIVVVEPDPGIEIGALNNAVANAEDPGNTIFELKRGGTYYLNGSLSHSGYTLHIRAEEGTGQRPVIQPAVDDLGASPENIIEAGGSLILEGLYLYGIDELGGKPNRTIVVSGDGNRIVANDCYFDYSNQTFFRLTSSNNKVFITNSILRNSIRPENPNNGRIIDTRGNPTDSLVIENCTMYNFSTSIFSLGTGIIDYIKMNHVTIFQSGITSYIPLDATIKADITNNILYNYAYRATDYEHQPMFTVDSIFNAGEYTDADRFFNISNNNWYTDPVFGEIIDEYGADTLVRYEPWDTEETNPIPWKYVARTDFFANQTMLDTSTTIPPPVLIHFINNGQTDTTNNFKEPLIFDNPPPLNLDYWTFFVEHNYNIREFDPPTPFADEDPILVGEVATGNYTFNYNDNSKSATAAIGGEPLGDPRWIPYPYVSNKDININSSKNTRVYPNPFTQKMTLEIQSDVESSVKIMIYNLVGKEVLMKRENIAKGKNLIPLSISAPSGIYMYQVSTESLTSPRILGAGRIVKQ